MKTLDPTFAPLLQALMPDATLEHILEWFDGAGDAFYLDLTRTMVHVRSEDEEDKGFGVEFRIQYSGSAERNMAMLRALAICLAVVSRNPEMFRELNAAEPEAPAAPATAT